MLEVADAGHHHRDAVSVCSLDAILVTYRSSRLGDSGDACLGSKGHAVVKGEEGITSEYGTLQLKAKVASLLDGLLQRIYSGGLSYT